MDILSQIRSPCFENAIPGFTPRPSDPLTERLDQIIRYLPVPQGLLIINSESSHARCINSLLSKGTREEVTSDKNILFRNNLDSVVETLLHIFYV